MSRRLTLIAAAVCASVASSAAAAAVESPPAPPATRPATAPAPAAAGGRLHARLVEPNSFEVRRGGPGGPPLLVVNAAPGFRPHVHPLHAPDGSGVLTQKPTTNYVHHCGLWIGLNNVMVGRRKHDFFYANEAFDPKPLARPTTDGDGRLTWAVQDDWRPWDRNRKKVTGDPVLTETQRWALTDRGTHYWLDLDWTLTAAGADVTFGRADYGGLFVRLENGGQARNSEGGVKGKDDKDAVEGKPARWVLLRDGGKTRGGKVAYVAIMDHKLNAGHPVAWREAGNHVGTSRCKTEEWTLKATESATSRYRVLVATGEPDVAFVESVWQDFVGGDATAAGGADSEGKAGAK